MMFFLGRGYRVIAHDRRGHGRSVQVPDGADCTARTTTGCVAFGVHNGDSCVGLACGLVGRGECADRRDDERLHRGLRRQDAQGTQAAREAAWLVGVALYFAVVRHKKGHVSSWEVACDLGRGGRI